MAKRGREDERGEGSNKITQQNKRKKLNFLE